MLVYITEQRTLSFIIILHFFDVHSRRLFPALLVGLRGLEFKTEYTISLRISSADPYRYKFLNMQWTAVGESEVMQNEERQIFRHPNSPNSGQFWMKKPISFKQVKITHNPASANGNVSRNSCSILKKNDNHVLLYSYRFFSTLCISM